MNLEVLITTAADDLLILSLSLCDSEKIRLAVSCESSAKQMIHMKCQVLFFLKYKK